MNERKPLVSIVMGSRHDWETLIHAATVLDKLKINYEVEGLCRKYKFESSRRRTYLSWARLCS